MIESFEGGGIGLLRQVTGLPRLPAGPPSKQQQDLVLEEAALLDFVTCFAHAVNSGDIDAVVDHYAADGMWISPRGRFAGTAEIRRNYEMYFSPVRWFSFWTNVAVRFVQPFDEAYVAAYQYSIGAGGSDPLSAGAVSTDVWHLKRSGSLWKIVERRIDILESHGHRVLPLAVA